MNDLKFSYDWVEPDDVSGVELAATWANLKISIDDTPITRVLDKKVKSIRDSIYIPLYPFAEWIVNNWWFLLYEPENPIKVKDNTYISRHCTVGGLEGFSLPRLSFIPTGNSTLIKWEPGESKYSSVEFLNSGQAHITAESINGEIYTLITAIVERLDEFGITGTFLQNEWDIIQKLDQEEVEFCKATSRIGLDPFAMDTTHQDLIIEYANIFPKDFYYEFLASVTINELVTDAKELISLYDDYSANIVHLNHLNTIKNELSDIPSSSPGESPWNAGYILAQNLRTSIGSASDPLPSIDNIIEALREDHDDIDSIRGTHEFTARLIDGLITITDDGMNGFVMRRRSENALKFLFCRGIAEFFFASGPGPLLLTKTSSACQQRNRAFSAEFLAPSMGLRSRITGDIVDEEEIEALAEEYQVSPILICHQLENHFIATPDYSHNSLYHHHK